MVNPLYYQYASLETWLFEGCYLDLHVAAVKLYSCATPNSMKEQLANSKNKLFETNNIVNSNDSFAESKT